MSSKPAFPKPLKDGTRRRWMTTWYDARGKRRSKSFGYTDDTTERQARARFNAWIATEYGVDADVRTPAANDTFTVTRLAARYLRHATTAYRKNGRLTSQIWNVRQAMRELRDAYGTLPAVEFDAPRLAKLRDAMIHGPTGRARVYKTVNARVFIVRQAFRWGREFGWVTAEQLADLSNVSGLKRGRTAARNPRKVAPVENETANAVINELPKPARALIELMGLTGMRPGEACAMRPCDLRMASDLWEYRPGSHKTEHLEQDRIVFLGPKCQRIITPFLDRPLNAPLFSPREAQAERLAARRAARKTPLYASHDRRRTYEPSSAVGDAYTAGSLRKAVAHACRAAGIAPAWTPNQLRHKVASDLVRKYDLEAAQVTLGHSDIATTQIYARQDVQRAMRVAREVG